MRGPDEKKTERARNLRKDGSNAEWAVWNGLRNRMLSGRKFVRQLPIGPYFADFACRELNLVVEIDGSQHNDSHDDRVRDIYMNKLGWSVARFVIGDKGPILDTIVAICEGEIAEPVRSPEFNFYPSWHAPHPNPLPAGGERGLYGASSETLMRRAIALARPGKTWPNPAVGCVLVKDGVVVGEGATGDGGRPHAEENALDMAGETARGATAYVTLEPCGKRSTGCASCSERLVAAGVARVVYACDDPSPYASHVGPQRLIDAGITVEAGLLEDEVAHLIAPFAHFLKTGSPMVRERDDVTGFDAEFQPEPDAELGAELVAWAGKGYRHLRVPEGSQLAAELRSLGYLTE
ncbi:hypothetical protein ABAC460_21010 [Asticcacaulis sp. AC460]|uniref:DUF559 domain-containing protein n=1 Tax=Asticcacaulis sp. AC460 TaxID=1282360 RepID=UPI0003C3FEDA|nr:DUF559 domain-containing protein [Asticcacaulis sp. AC460]ESQ87051.1 hypothetical protein ABAC460_21010 [Asticcacaulis sp. AC460]